VGVCVFLSPRCSFTSKPAARAEQDQVRAWLAQIRQECGVRLCEQIFAADPKKPSKFWMAFKAKKFMNKVRRRKTRVCVMRAC
jgi:actin related protein 2/3 complex subunit 3